MLSLSSANKAVVGRLLVQMTSAPGAQAFGAASRRFIDNPAELATSRRSGGGGFFLQESESRMALVPAFLRRRFRRRRQGTRGRGNRAWRGHVPHRRSTAAGEDGRSSRGGAATYRWPMGPRRRREGVPGGCATRSSDRLVGQTGRSRGHSSSGSRYRNPVSDMSARIWDRADHLPPNGGAKGRKTVRLLNNHPPLLRIHQFTHRIQSA